MATVDGITVAAADAIDKKHIASMAVVGGNLNLTRENASVLSVALPSGGGGGIPGGIQAFNCIAGSNYGAPGVGAQYTPTTWSDYESESLDFDGSYASYPVPEIAHDSSGLILSSIKGWLMVRVAWYFYWDASSPTSFGIWAESNGQSPRHIQYFPVAPSRTYDGAIEGQYTNYPHTTGEITTFPTFADVIDPILNLRFWWNTNDTAPKGGFFPGPIPTVQAQVMLLADLT